MTGLLIAAGWCVLAIPVAVLIGRGLRAMDPGEDLAPAPAPVDPPAPADAPGPDGQTDLLAGLPVDALGQADVDALFLRLVAPLDREHR